VTATAADNVAVAGVQFLLDGAALGAEQTTGPYAYAWNTSGTSNGGHTLSARARDAAGNSTTATNVPVTVSNSGAAGLVAAYAFSEATGTTVTDSSGNNNTGTLGTGVTRTTQGKYGSGLVFNGTSGRVTVNDAATLRLTNGMTLEAWVNPSTVNSAWRDVIYKGNDNYYLEATSDNASRPGAGATLGTIYGAAALAANTWTHLAVTYDGATLRLYVNGVLVSSLAVTGTLPTSTNPLQVGGAQLAEQRDFLEDCCSRHEGPPRNPGALWWGQAYDAGFPLSILNAARSLPPSVDAS